MICDFNEKSDFTAENCDCFSVLRLEIIKSTRKLTATRLRERTSKVRASAHAKLDSPRIGHDSANMRVTRKSNLPAVGVISGKRSF